MRKKLTAILIALTIAVSLLPMPVIAAVSDDETAVIKEAVTKMVTDYAAQVYRPNADEETFGDYFNHAFFGKSADMVLQENDAMVSVLFNSYLMQEALIDGITNGIILSQKLNQSAVYLGRGPQWHNYGYSYQYTGYFADHEDESKYLSIVASSAERYADGMYSGPKNENDEVLELLVGSLEGGIVIRRIGSQAQSARYEIHLQIEDRFDFDGDYEKIADKGYDTSTDENLNNLGWMLTFMGLDEFDWMFQKTLYIETPVSCKHESGAYSWSYDAATNILESIDTEGFIRNDTTHYEHISESTGILYHYYKLENTVVLHHDLPWALEYDMQPTKNIKLGIAPDPGSAFPTIFLYGSSYQWIYTIERTKLPDGQTTESGSTFKTKTHYYGAQIKGLIPSASTKTYTYRLENRVNEDSSNMVYLSVIDTLTGQTVIEGLPLDGYWNGSESAPIPADKTTNGISGQDIYINYIGSKYKGITHDLFDLRIWENGKDATPNAGVYTAPTCTEQGGYLHHCLKCGGDYLTDAEAALGHDFGEYVEDNNTTCNDDGTKTRVCNVCSEKDTVIIEGSAYGHSYGEFVDDGNTTCTVDGSETRTCDTCGNTETRTIEGSAQGHKFGTYQFNHNSTCTTNGTMTAVCEVCGEKDVVSAEGSATGHNHKATVTAPTCTEQGYTTYTCHCGDSYVNDYTEPTPHKEITLPAIPSTCVEKGKTEGKQCELCGEITVPQTPTAYGNHTWDAGTVIKQPTLTEPGTLMYTCIHCSKTSHMSITEMPSTGFNDVPADAYYAAAVAWAKENGITSGLSANIFGSDMSCTRGQVVTFLWAAAGRPEPKTSDNPFADVAESDYFYKPVLWAVENGITGGIGDGLFGPHETCTRGQIVTFLWASQGKPASGSSTFTDVADTDWYAKSVVWAAENQVTGGIGNNMFGPNNTCTRAQVVTFLYKVYG